MRRARLLATSLVALGLTLTACGSDDGGGDDGPGAQEVAGGEVLASTWPLTGLPAKGDDSSAQKHPALVVKIDNTAASAPQEGLGSADLVVEELVEGGMTRLAAFFYSDLPDTAGPVRSMRASDIGIVKPADATMVTSGAAPVTIKRIKESGIDFFGEDGPGFYREASRTAPYNLFTDLGDTAKGAALDKEARPDDYLPWGAAGDLPQGQPARTISAKFSQGHTTSWAFEGGTYVNQNSFAADGDEFPADTVLVLRVQVGDAGYRDPAGNPVPETKLDGSGAALLFHDGRLVRGTWKKTGVAAPLKLSTQAGELTVPAGRTWIELVPAKDGDVTFAK